MNIALMDQYSDEEFANIVASSYSYKQCLQKLGYKSNSGVSTNKLKEKINALQLDTSHFLSINNINRIKREPLNIFIKDSTASQKTLRKYYKEGNYTEYKCSICGLEPFWNGKELTLILDHINGYNNDDRLENLRWVCPNCNYQLDTTNGKNINHQLHPVVYCIDCGKPISPGATRCQICANKKSALKRKIPLEEMPVTRDELKKLIRTTPFIKIGNLYGVSDNTIRKWCDKFGLPRKATEIKQIPNNDWEKI